MINSKVMMPQFEFHISRRARQRYQFDETLFTLSGNVILANPSAARRFAEKMSSDRTQPVPASDINAMGLIDEALHMLVRQYKMLNPGVLGAALTSLESNMGPGAVEGVLLEFTDQFPPLVVYKGELSAKEYLTLTPRGREDGARETSLEELILLYVSNLNPALEAYRELFDDVPLRQSTPYEEMIKRLENFFEASPAFESNGESLLQALRAPALASPHSLDGQIEYILERWGAWIDESFFRRLLRGLDLIKEHLQHWGMGGGVPPVLEYGGAEAEYERFSADRDWMPRLVLIAKNTYVWLDQLSKKYQREVRRLDQIPNEELDLLTQRGFSGLWLIGLWERSQASRRIKQIMGQGQAVASAYSLYDYSIAADLGGQAAYADLARRAWERGLRLAADMVPNHMGIDSQWVIEHPDWFLELPYPPYPGYSFNGPDLSDDERVGIFIEDHYYNRSDAAVVFKRLDRWTGDARYIYHGNDGTSFPWNDTAQLDYLKPEVREAVIQTILSVARHFPIIRFDAAMTLAKKHIQRLWYPPPGAGGAIPSRSEYGLNQAEFEAAMPHEFWREVVDRVAAEVPDTLLLAEAFWMMEGYFVRTLGMHRVYNSAFMHMLRDEDNAKYRQVMKNTLEFDPQVLKRFVNFMNNPDEATAAEQFGTTEKYFGVCTLMITLPGLPMFGHGQIQGFREKYGMEFRRALWDEQLDEGLVRGHEWRIFPLLHRRRLFAEVENFLLYDFYTQDGHVNEDVFAYSNRLGEERGLVVYHNKYAQARGWLKTSAAYMNKGRGELVQRSLAEGLGLPGGERDYAIFKDYVNGLEYLRPCRQLSERGLYVELSGYQCHVFLDWRLVHDADGKWGAVHQALNGAGVPSVQGKWDEMFVEQEEAAEVGVKKTKKAAKKSPAKKTGERKKGASSKGKANAKKSVSKKK
jgi:glycosidase